MRVSGPSKRWTAFRRAGVLAAVAVVALAVTMAPVGAADSTTTTAKSSGKKVKALNPRVTIKIPDLQVASEAGLYTAMERGYFAERGIDIELLGPLNSVDQVPLLATGDLGVGIGTPTTTFFNASANGIDIKFVCTWTTQEEGDGAFGLYVRKELIDSGQVKSIADLKGKNIGTASVTDPYALSKVLESADLTLDDVTMVGLNYPDQVAAFAGGSIDAAMVLEPFGIQAENRGLAKRLAPAGDYAPGPAVFVAVGPAFARANPEAVTKFLEAFMLGQRDYEQAFFGDGTDRDEVLGILTQHTRIKDPAQYEALVAKQAMPRPDPNCTLPKAKEINDYQDVFTELGSQPKRVKASDVLDSKYLKQALKQIGKADTSTTPAASTTTAAK